ncbi:mitogen-activated protein kinase kinase kinase 1-like [Gastrolobium bilobum]|uniref:mitogen-activated protein kinase kinase kinase 1-like n=1 Tax=Gastrolobium bilobum TaxID=150636 RepID=UPI002AB1CCA5|nr:mitogen-activated protein kinase kinase kinase 1-like [Gastrolobium bilobum]
MHHLLRIFGHSKQTTTMDAKKLRRKPKLERRNAHKHFEYDAVSSSSSLDDSSSSSGSLYTRSMEFYHRTSFRIEGVEGEFDRICRSLGLSGPEDFAIPAAAWEAMKVRSSSDILPRLKLTELDSQEKEEPKVKEESNVAEGCDLGEKFEERVRVRVRVRDETAETTVCCTESGGGGGGIKGVRPPMLKPPPGVRVQVVDNECSTWDLLRDFAPQGEGDVPREAAEKEEGEVGGVSPKREDEERVDNAARIAEIVAELSGSCSFTTSNEDDSSSTATDPRSNNISPNGRIRRIITPGRWQKGGLLGRGSFGSVYEGISDDGFFFAVKEVSLLDQGNQGKQSVYQLDQEIALLSQFEHENIVQYHGTEMDESTLYIFLELVTKGSLGSLYRRYTLRDSQVSAYTRQILHGLKYLHDRNVVHRDIKCANILVHASGSVKLADFGLAKATKLNDVKSCKGTAFWMAPEVVKGKNKGYGLPADIWSLGCTVLEMLSGKIPYSQLECMQALFRIGKGERPPIPDSLSKDARDLILQCLQVNPDDRPTAAELLNHPFIQRPISQSSGSSLPHVPGRKG